MRNLYIGETKREIRSAFFVAKLFGTISQKTRSKKVTTHVEIHMARDSQIPKELARSVAITVANAAVNVFTRLFQMSMVLKSLSFLSLMYFRACAQKSHFLTSESILCDGRLISAISVPEKNHDNKNKMTKRLMTRGSIMCCVSELLKIECMIRGSKLLIYRLYTNFSIFFNFFRV